jgi:hypothetical protein
MWECQCETDSWNSEAWEDLHIGMHPNGECCGGTYAPSEQNIPTPFSSDIGSVVLAPCDHACMSTHRRQTESALDRACGGSQALRNRGAIDGLNPPHIEGVSMFVIIFFTLVAGLS